MLRRAARRRPALWRWRGQGWRVWLLAARPATLPAAIAPVLVGTAQATADADLRVGPFAATLAAAILLQIGANFANDLFDFKRGADRADRLGPTRATQAGLVTPAQMRGAMALAFAAAAGAGAYLTVVVGWPIVVIGVAAVLAAIAYTGGPWPYGYRGLGDLFVFIFFGLVAVMGSAYVQVEELTWEAFAAALPVGLLVTAILVVNNLRDIDGDRRSGKRTLAVILGPSRTRLQYQLFVLGAFALAPIFASADLLPWWSLETSIALPLGLYLVGRVRGGASGRSLNAILKLTAQLHLLFGALLAVAFLW